MWKWKDEFVIEIILLSHILSPTSHQEFLVEAINYKKISFMNLGYLSVAVLLDISQVELTVPWKLFSFSKKLN